MTRRCRNALRAGGPALAAALALGAALRLHGLTFGLPAVNDPDELMFELGAVKMLAGKTLNPGWFGHPATTTMYLLAAIDVLLFLGGLLLGEFSSVKAFAAAIYRDPGWVMIPHRAAMVCLALGAVALTARLAAKVWGKDRAAGRGGAKLAAIAAAALLAVNPVHVAWSQVIRSDVMGSFFMLLGLLAAVDLAELGRRRDWLRSAGWLALAVATKWPFALGALAIVGAAGLRIGGGADLRRTLAALAMTAGLAALLLIAISPYLALAYPTALANLAGEAQRQHLGATGGTPLDNLAWYLRGPLYAGCGAVGLALAACGLWAGRRNRLILCVVLPVALGFIAALAAQKITWERWTLPLFPLAAVLSGGGLAWVLRMLGASLTRTAAHVAAAALLIVAAAPLAQQSWLRGTERLNDTRQQATRWAQAHIPAGSTILIEHFAFDLLDSPWAFRFPLGDSGCVDARLLLANKLQYGVIERGRGRRTNVDYGTLNPSTRATCAADFAIITQADRYAAEASRFPQENKAYKNLMASGREVARFAPVPGTSAGPTTRIIRLRK